MRGREYIISTIECKICCALVKTHIIQEYCRLGFFPLESLLPMWGGGSKFYRKEPPHQAYHFQIHRSTVTSSYTQLPPPQTQHLSLAEVNPSSHIQLPSNKKQEFRSSPLRVDSIPSRDKFLHWWVYVIRPIAREREASVRLK